MSEFPKVTKGDYVRVVLEGEVTWLGNDDRFELGAGIVYPKAFGGPVKSIEILPEPLKVGDTNLTREQLLSLPPQAVLITDSGIVFRKGQNNKFYTINDSGSYAVDFVMSYVTLRLAHLPQ